MTSSDMKLIDLVPEGEELMHALSGTVPGWDSTTLLYRRFVLRALLWLMWNVKLRSQL